MILRRSAGLIFALTLCTVLSGIALGSFTVRAQQSEDQPYLGVRVVVTANGTQITMIDFGSPAESGGLRVGDIITAVGGEKVTADNALETILKKYRSGMRVVLSIRRGNLLLQRPITFGSEPAPTNTPGATSVISVAAAPTKSIPVPTDTRAPTSTPTPTVTASVTDTVAPSPTDTALPATEAATEVPPTATVPGTATPVANPVIPTATAPGAESTEATVATVATVAAPMPTSEGRAQLGVEFEDVTPELSQSRHLSVNYGALVIAVIPGSPADVAGIKAGDVITNVDGDRVDARRNLSYRLMPYQPGDSLTLTIARGTDTLTLSVTLASHGVALSNVY